MAENNLDRKSILYHYLTWAQLPRWPRRGSKEMRHCVRSLYTWRSKTWSWRHEILQPPAVKIAGQGRRAIKKIPAVLRYILQTSYQKTRVNAWIVHTTHLFDVEKYSLERRHYTIKNQTAEASICKEWVRVCNCGKADIQKVMYTVREEGTATLYQGHFAVFTLTICSIYRFLSCFFCLSLPSFPFLLVCVCYVSHPRPSDLAKMKAAATTL